MIRVFKTGYHANRTPLSYRALASLFADEILLVEQPQDADLYVFAHCLDVEEAPLELVRDWRRRRRPVVWLSEEPFWDTIWGPDPLAPEIIVETEYGALPVIQLSHQTSDIFRFDRIPYYLLTNPRFAKSYARMFARNAALSAADWRAEFARRNPRLTFMFERRPEAYHDCSWPSADLIGLCAWRTRLAEACSWDGVERLGQSWQDGPTRFELENWHADKLTQLDGHCRMMAAFENTHHPDYLTEKLFDAFACGAIPLYWASPFHRIHELGLPEESWLNCFDMEPDACANALEHFARSGTGVVDFDAYRAAQIRLHTLFSDPSIIKAERARLKRALVDALQQVLDSTPEASRVSQGARAEP